MSQEFITIKVWKSTRQKAKVMAAHRDISLSFLFDESLEALKEMRRSYGSNWQDKFVQERRDDNYFNEEYS